MKVTAIQLNMPEMILRHGIDWQYPQRAIRIEARTSRACRQNPPLVLFVLDTKPMTAREDQLYRSVSVLLRKLKIISNSRHIGVFNGLQKPVSSNHLRGIDASSAFECGYIR